MTNVISETKKQIQDAIYNSIKTLAKSIDTTDEQIELALGVEIETEIPKEKSHGDFSSNNVSSAGSIKSGTSGATSTAAKT